MALAPGPGSGAGGPRRGGDIPKPKGKSGSRPSHEEMFAQMGLQGSEYWTLWETAKGALLRSTLEYGKWRLVSEDEKARSGKALYNDPRLGDRQRAVLETPWVLDYFLKTRWNIDRSNRRYVRNPPQPILQTSVVSTSTAPDLLSEVGGAAVAGELTSSSSAPLADHTSQSNSYNHHTHLPASPSSQIYGIDGLPSPVPETPPGFQYQNTQPYDTPSPGGIGESGAGRRREGIGWMLNPGDSDTEDDSREDDRA